MNWLERLLHMHVWEISAKTADGPIEQSCSCGAVRHTLFVGADMWRDGPSPTAQEWRRRINTGRVVWPC